MSKRKFTWWSWDYDCCGDAYIIAKDECPNKEDVPKFIVKEDRLSDKCLAHTEEEINNPAQYLSVNSVKEGWCRFEVRSDWGNLDSPCGGYAVYECKNQPVHSFPVWIVRKGEWY